MIGMRLGRPCVSRRPWAVARNEQLRIRSRYLLSPSDHDQNNYVKPLKVTFHIAFLGPYHQPEFLCLYFVEHIGLDAVILV